MQNAEGDGASHYQCSICKLYYAEKQWAEQCEAWCREHPSCNTEITKHAVELEGGKEV